MATLVHWALVAGALVAWGLAIASHDASYPTWTFIGAGWAFFACVVAAAIHEWPRVSSTPWRGHRVLAWSLTAVIAAFVPVLLLTGATKEESLLRAPFAFANYGVFLVPYLCLLSETPPTRAGRFSPTLLALLAVILNLVVSSRA